MKNYLFIIAALISFNSFGQTWKYSEGGNAFDGKYKTSVVTGVGTKRANGAAAGYSQSA